MRNSWRALIVALILSSVAIVGLARWIWIERQSAQIEQRRTLAGKRKAEQLRKAMRAMYVEQGRQLLRQEDPLRALSWLGRAYEEGSEDHALPSLIADAIRPVDALVASMDDHHAEVTSAAFSPDGTRIITTSEDKTAKLWDGQTGKLLSTLSGHRNTVTSGVFSPDGKRVITTSDDKAVKLWEVEKGVLLSTFAGNDRRAEQAIFSVDGKRILTIESGPGINAWNAQDGALITSIKDTSRFLKTLQFSPDGKLLLLAGGLLGSLELRDGHTLAALSARPYLGRMTRDVHFSTDGKRLFSGYDHGVQIWDIQKHKLATQWKMTDNTHMRVSPNQRQVLLQTRDHRIEIWSLEDGNLVQLLRGHQARIHSARWSPNGAHIVTSSDDGSARIWDAKSGLLSLILAGHTDIVKDAQWSPDGSRVLTIGRDRSVKLWSIRNRNPLLTIDTPVEVTDQGATSASLAVQLARPLLSPDGTRLLTTDLSKTAKLWDVRSGDLVATLSGHADGIDSTRFSPDGSRILTEDRSDVRKVWDAKGTELKDAKLDRSAFAAAENAEQKTFDGKQALYNFDGSRVMTEIDGASIKLHDAKTKQLIATIDAEAEAQHSLPLRAEPSVLWSRDGSRILTLRRGPVAKLWDGQTGRLLLSLPNHSDDVEGASFSPDGERLVTVTQSREVKLWDVPSATLLMSLQAPSWRTSIEWTPDGKRLLVLSGISYIWDMHTEPRSAQEISKLIKERVPAQFRQAAENADVAPCCR